MPIVERISTLVRANINDLIDRAEDPEKVASGPGAYDHWLLVSPGGLEVAWLHAVEGSEQPGEATFKIGASALPLVSATSATVDVQSRSGSAPAVLVKSWMYRSDQQIALAEQWPDGTLDCYAGAVVSQADVEIWPAATAVRQTVGTT